MADSSAADTSRKACCYEPIAKLGTGGMGEVWRAKHGLLERPAAIKYIRPEALGLADADASRRLLRQFEQEAQVTASLSSPHTIDLYDFGVAEDGRFYYVMELLRGLDLWALVRDFGPVPTDRAIHFLSQVCHSLAEAHAAGLVHRDVKPANIYSCQRGLDYDFIKVLDFGLVRQLDDAGDLAPGTVAGTPAFMAPEIVQADYRLDARSDIYSLGCVAYWLVTGQLVFEGESSAEVIEKHVREDPISPRGLSELEIPEVFESVVMSCLEKEPGRRPPTAVALSKQFEQCKAVAGIWTEDRAEYWWTLHKPADDRAAPD